MIIIKSIKKKENENPEANKKIWFNLLPFRFSVSLTKENFYLPHFKARKLDFNLLKDHKMSVLD